MCTKCLQSLEMFTLERKFVQMFTCLSKLIFTDVQMFTVVQIFTVVQVFTDMSLANVHNRTGCEGPSHDTFVIGFQLGPIFGYFHRQIAIC